MTQNQHMNLMVRWWTFTSSLMFKILGCWFGWGVLVLASSTLHHQVQLWYAPKAIEAHFHVKHIDITKLHLSFTLGMTIIRPKGPKSTCYDPQKRLLQSRCRSKVFVKQGISFIWNRWRSMRLTNVMQATLSRRNKETQGRLWNGWAHVGCRRFIARAL